MAPGTAATGDGGAHLLSDATDRNTEQVVTGRRVSRSWSQRGGAGEDLLSQD